jgi:hypothetical protein
MSFQSPPRQCIAIFKPNRGAPFLPLPPLSGNHPHSLTLCVRAQPVCVAPTQCRLLTFCNGPNAAPVSPPPPVRTLARILTIDSPAARGDTLKENKVMTDANNNNNNNNNNHNDDDDERHYGGLRLYKFLLLSFRDVVKLII